MIRILAKYSVDKLQSSDKAADQATAGVCNKMAPSGRSNKPCEGRQLEQTQGIRDLLVIHLSILFRGRSFWVCHKLR